MENVEEAQRFLAEYGWQASPDPHLDKRAVHPLSPLMQPPVSPRRQEPKGSPSRPRSRQDGARVRQSALQLTRELSRLASGLQKSKDSMEVAAMPSDKGKAELLERQAERVKRFNALGVFKPSVSVIRARAMYHVELARRLKSVDLNRRMSCKPVEPKAESAKDVVAPPPGLHNKLDRLLSTNPTLVLTQALARSPTQRRKLTRQQTRRRTGAPAKEPSRLDLMVQERTRQLVSNVQARTQEAAQKATAEMVARYRTRMTDIEQRVKAHADEARLARLANIYRGQASSAGADVMATSITSGDVTAASPAKADDTAAAETRANEAVAVEAEEREGANGQISRKDKSVTLDGSTKEGGGNRQSATDDKHLQRLGDEELVDPGSREKQIEDESRAPEGGVLTAEGETVALAGGASLPDFQIGVVRASIVRRRLPLKERLYKTRNAQKWAALGSSLPFQVPDATTEEPAEALESRSLEEDANVRTGVGEDADNRTQGDDVFENREEQRLGQEGASNSTETDGKEAVLNPDTFGIAERLQARLERVWEVLRTPTSAKVDMVIKYTLSGHARRLEAALQCWEAAAAAVVVHERAVKEWEAAYPAPFEPTDGAQEKQLLTEQIDLAQKVLESAATAEEALGDLKATFGEDLLIQGTLYEPRFRGRAQIETTLKALTKRREKLERHVT